MAFLFLFSSEFREYASCIRFSNEISDNESSVEEQTSERRETQKIE